MRSTHDRRTGSWTAWLADHANHVIVASILLTGLLAIPFLTMQPTTSASQEPEGEIFSARDQIEEEFASSVFNTFVIVEARSGDILRAEPLRELLAAEQTLRTDPEMGPTLFEYFEASQEAEVHGVWTVADLVDRSLPGGLADATDLAVKGVIAEALSTKSATELGLSVQTTTNDQGLPVSPALLFPVLSDTNVLGFASSGVRIGTDTEPEEYSREVVELIRGSETSYQAWGVANDVNLTAAEQGEEAGPFIGFTILAVLLIVGFAFRSYWVLAVTGAALAALIIWLQGISNLIGLEEDLVLSLIVPIAMISFGVDFMFHAVGRYREFRLEARVPRAAFTVGLAAVFGALVLALASDSAAFLSNSVAPIESIVQFGIGAAIALVAAFLLLGVVTPLAVMKIEERVGTSQPSRRHTVSAVTGAALAGSVAMTSVLLSVFILPVGGVIALAVYLLLFLFVPYRLATPSLGSGIPARSGGPGRPTQAIGAAVAASARYRWMVLPAVGVVTAVAVMAAVQIPTEFDVKDFFASDTGFVVGLDKLDEHGGAVAGEPATILIDTDLSDPEALAAVDGFVAEFRSLDTDSFGTDEEGNVNIQAGVLSVIDDTWSSPVAQGAVTRATGVVLTDEDGDGLPDSREQLTALYQLTRQAGVPFDAQNLIQTPDDVRSVLSADYATKMEVGLPGSREVENIVEARQEAAPLIEALEFELRSIDPNASAVLTGGPIARQESLDAISRALQVSLPIAVAICLLIGSVFMRSFRYGLVSIIPILVVVAWLYAFMYVFGFAINLVTATIGAVSIGIGIDFAIHFAMRYREELSRTGSREAAVRASGEGTGVALVASATSSIVGFAVLAFAPMPLFASYGFLTAVMIAMALAASLLVLPSLLVLITRDSQARPQEPRRQPVVPRTAR